MTRVCGAKRLGYKIGADTSNTFGEAIDKISNGTIGRILNARNFEYWVILAQRHFGHGHFHPRSFRSLKHFGPMSFQSLIIFAQSFRSPDIEVPGGHFGHGLFRF